MLTGLEIDGAMIEIKATEAKARLAEMLSRVERGESIAITRYGQRIAHLIPAETQDQELRQQQVEKFRDRRRKWGAVKLSDKDVLALRHEGHRV